MQVDASKASEKGSVRPKKRVALKPKKNLLKNAQMDSVLALKSAANTKEENKSEGVSVIAV